jgi:hypothetical protein
MTRRRGWRLKQLLNDLEEKRWFCKLKGEALNRPPCEELSLEGAMEL